VVLYEDSCISTRGHSGGPVIPHPVALRCHTDGLKAVRPTGHRVRVCCAQSIIEYEAVAVAKQQPIRGQIPKTQDPRCPSRRRQCLQCRGPERLGG
jgi:hypothetical protein